MPDPLINRDRLAAVIYGAEVDQGDWRYDGPTVRTAEVVLAYLREVLTPDVLHPAGYDHDGYDLHKRIFGEDA